MTESPDLITQLREALDEHAARFRAANEQSARNLRQLERIDTILDGGQIDQANGERERKLLNLVASYHETRGNPVIAHRLSEQQETMDALREFGPELRRLREKHRIYLGELAAVLGCKTTVLSDLELGLTGTAGSRAPSTADWDALNRPWVSTPTSRSSARSGRLLREEVAQLKGELEASRAEVTAQAEQHARNIEVYRDLDAKFAELGRAAARMPAQIANDAMPPGYKLIVHTNEHGTTAYRWTMPLTEGQNWPSPAEALRGAWERTTHHDREGFAELEALMQEINGILRASGRGRDSQTSASVIREGFAELAEIRGLILAAGRTMNNLSAPQVLREVLAEAGEAAQARADLEKLMAEKARPIVTMPTVSATPDARDMDRIRDLLHERRARLAVRDGEACTWPELVRGLLDDLHTADLNAAHMEAKLAAADAAATRLAELDAAWAKAGYTRPLTAESLKSVPVSGRYLPLD